MLESSDGKRRLGELELELEAALGRLDAIMNCARGTGSAPPRRVLLGGDLNATLPGLLDGCAGAGTFSKSVKVPSLLKTERRMWVLKLMARYRLTAANAFPGSPSNAPGSWAAWGMGKVGTRIPPPPTRSWTTCSRRPA